MEGEFRTTFIPKKPVVAVPTPGATSVSRPVGILFVIGLVIFIATGVIAGGAYGYRALLTKDVADLQVSLKRVQDNLETNVIKEFTIMDKRLRNAQTLVSGHTVIGQVFTVLSSTTLPTVRYTKMDVSFDESRNLVATLSGESDGYRSIALQSQALSEKANIKDMIFSNFVVTPKGRVSFDMSFSIPAADLSFTKMVAATDSVDEISSETVIEETPTAQESFESTSSDTPATEQVITTQ